ncbi:hypothetical protein R3P38DRAFT_3536651 [Favolaschia claudopus]|uniref:Uncharacterized protein n=1 Tax=Favolaschia claudopus TaxID=2862362 RepID=A0AAW0B9L7_9AGAR
MTTWVSYSQVLDLDNSQHAPRNPQSGPATTPPILRAARSAFALRHRRPGALNSDSTYLTDVDETTFTSSFNATTIHVTTGSIQKTLTRLDSIFKFVCVSLQRTTLTPPDLQVSRDSPLSVFPIYETRTLCPSTSVALLLQQHRIHLDPYLFCDGCCLLKGRQALLGVSRTDLAFLIGCTRLPKAPPHIDLRLLPPLSGPPQQHPGIFFLTLSPARPPRYDLQRQRQRRGQNRRFKATAINVTMHVYNCPTLTALHRQARAYHLSDESFASRISIFMISNALSTSTIFSRIPCKATNVASLPLGLILPHMAPEPSSIFRFSPSQAENVSNGTLGRSYDLSRRKLNIVLASPVRSTFIMISVSPPFPALSNAFRPFYPSRSRFSCHKAACLPLSPLLRSFTYLCSQIQDLLVR